MTKAEMLAAAGDKGLPGIDGYHWKLGRGKKGFCLVFGHITGDTLIADCRKTNFCCYKPPVCGTLWQP